jgi:Holliday junction resolvase RusA-like endonuclease
LDGPGAVTVTVVARMPIPASFSVRRRSLALQGRILPTGRPDVDNVAKLVLDALNGVFWRDDAQIVDLAATKVYGQAPGLQIAVEQREQDGEGQ